MSPDPRRSPSSHGGGYGGRDGLFVLNMHRNFTGVTANAPPRWRAGQLRAL